MPITSTFMIPHPPLIIPAVGRGEEQMEVSYDTTFVDKLCALADEKDLPAGTLGEHDRKLDHGTMVPLYFDGCNGQG